PFARIEEQVVDPRRLQRVEQVDVLLEGRLGGCREEVRAEHHAARGVWLLIPDEGMAALDGPGMLPAGVVLVDAVRDALIGARRAAAKGRHREGGGRQEAEHGEVVTSREGCHRTLLTW